MYFWFTLAHIDSIPLKKHIYFTPITYTHIIWNYDSHFCKVTPIILHSCFRVDMTGIERALGGSGVVYEGQCGRPVKYLQAHLLPEHECWTAEGGWVVLHSRFVLGHSGSASYSRPAGRDRWLLQEPGGSYMFVFKGFSIRLNVTKSFTGGLNYLQHDLTHLKFNLSVVFDVLHMIWNILSMLNFVYNFVFE